MPDTENYDVLVIGSGEADKYQSGAHHGLRPLHRAQDRGRGPGRRRDPPSPEPTCSSPSAVPPTRPGIGLELAGVELTEAGYIKVDEHLATTADRVWAMGDSDEILGFTAFGAEASELMAAAQVAIMARMP